MLAQVFAQASIVNDFANLGGQYSTAVLPQPLSDPEWVHFNEGLAQRLGLDMSTA